MYKYLNIKEVHAEFRKNIYIINIEADYYREHPMYGEKPLRDRVFTIACKEGKWNIQEPDLWNN